MSAPIATVAIDSDWGTLQLVTQGATLGKVDGIVYPPGITFTPAGVLFGQPNENLTPQVVEFQVYIFVNDPTVTFITGKGDTGSKGPQAGSITVTLADTEYTNTYITGDGLNIQAFYNAPLYKY